MEKGLIKRIQTQNYGVNVGIQCTNNENPITSWVISGQLLDAKATLPYLSPELTGENLLVGANFASAGSGILNDTGVQFVS